MTFNLIDMHVLPGTAWMVDFGRLADAVFPVLAIVLVGLAPPHPRFCASTRGESATVSKLTPVRPVFPGRQARHPIKCPGKACLRRKARLKGYLCKRQFAGRYFRHRLLQTHPADIAAG
jgi:hypothetical protein